MFCFSVNYSDITSATIQAAEDKLDLAFAHRAKVIASGGMGINTLNVGSFVGTWGVEDGVRGSSKGKSKGTSESCPVLAITDHVRAEQDLLPSRPVVPKLTTAEILAKAPRRVERGMSSLLHSSCPPF